MHAYLWNRWAYTTSLHTIILPFQQGGNSMYMIRFDSPYALSKIQKLDFDQVSNLSQDQIIMC